MGVYKPVFLPMYAPILLSIQGRCLACLPSHEHPTLKKHIPSCSTTYALQHHVTNHTIESSLRVCRRSKGWGFFFSACLYLFQSHLECFKEPQSMKHCVQFWLEFKYESIEFIISSCALIMPRQTSWIFFLLDDLSNVVCWLYW